MTNIYGEMYTFSPLVPGLALLPRDNQHLYFLAEVTSAFTNTDIHGFAPFYVNGCFMAVPTELHSYPVDPSTDPS